MRRKKGQNDDGELNYWQPASDMFIALLLILMLIILLLGLYLVRIPEHDQPDPNAGDTYAERRAEEDPHGTVSPSPTVFFWFPNAGNGDGAGDTPHPTYTDWGHTPSPSPSPTVSPTPDFPGAGAAGGGGGEGGGEGAGEGIGEEPDAGMKSAVYVMVVDAETGRVIKEPNIEFELFSEKGALQILNNYYPDRVSYRFFETRDDGTFYLPEKLELGGYELRELTEPESYDSAGSVKFVLNAVYDWTDPLVVEVLAYPSRNTIDVQVCDSVTGAGLEGASFDVIAEENILTADGTLRYRRGQTVGVIECDEQGYGVSEELYLGSYLLRQRGVPRYYIALEDDIPVQVEKRTQAQTQTHRVSCSRTAVTVTLTDEYYPQTGISGAVFNVYSDKGDSIEAVTDSKGTFTLDALEKSAAYRIRQTASSGDYRVNPAEQVFSVSPDGRIGGQDSADLQFTNRMIRVNIGLTDEFSTVQVPGVQLAIFNQQGAMLRSWTTSVNTVAFTNLEPGQYYVIVGGDTDKQHAITIVDQAIPQTININTTYILHYVIIGGGAVGLILLAVFLISLIRRTRKRRKDALREPAQRYRGGDEEQNGQQ